jgi:hypothetical protein
MFSELSATGYSQNKVFYHAELEDILSKVVACYNLMLADRVPLTNDENKIRDILLIRYLKNNAIRSKVKLIDYLFDREVPEDTTRGRTDIKVQTLNTFQDTAAYYIIECKRLDAINPKGKMGLNAKYIEGGIMRFTSQSYSTHYNATAMIGFVVQEVDINMNVALINDFLRTSYKDANTTCELSHIQLSADFNFSYYSKHMTGNDEIIIYHLMFDFSKSLG